MFLLTVDDELINADFVTLIQIQSLHNNLNQYIGKRMVARTSEGKWYTLKKVTKDDMTDEMVEDKAQEYLCGLYRLLNNMKG